MTDDLGLFVAIAEIAGVFVGFAALISVTGRDEVAPGQLAQVRAVVTIGLVVIVAALVPVGLERYGLSSEALWRTSSAAFLALVWAVIGLSLRRPENRALTLSQARRSPGLSAVFWGVLEVAIQLPLLLAVLGLAPDLARAFYTTALVVHLFQAAFVLGQFVYIRVAEPPAEDPEPPEDDPEPPTDDPEPPVSRSGDRPAAVADDPGTAERDAQG